MTNRVVLDTNVVLSALIFSAGRLAWVRHAWQRQRIQPLISTDTANELIRVLAYPKFRLAPDEQRSLIAEFLPHAEVVTLPTPWPDLPACSDEHDQVFIVLAHVARADRLVTGDADLLAMRDAFPGLIVTPEQFALEQGA